MFGLLAAVSVITFLLFNALPSDPAALTCGKSCTPEVIEKNRERLGYDKPIIEQYGDFVSGIFVGRTYGSGTSEFECGAPCLGYSFSKGEEVTELIVRALPVTTQLAVGGFVLWIILGVGVGIISALRKGKWQDRLGLSFVLIGTSLPHFLRVSFIYSRLFFGYQSFLFLDTWNSVPTRSTGSSVCCSHG